MPTKALNAGFAKRAPQLHVVDCAAVIAYPVMLQEGNCAPHPAHERAPSKTCAPHDRHGRRANAC